MYKRQAEALGMDKSAVTPGEAVGRIWEMGRSNSPADIQGLVKARELLGPQNWGDIQSGTLYNLGVKTGGDGASTFSVQTLVKNYGELTPNGKNLLFGGESGIKPTVEALVGIAPQIARVEKLSQPNAIGDWLGGILGWGHLPVTHGAGLPLIVGNWGLSQILSRPGLGAPATGYLKAAADWALNPNAPKAEAAFRAQTLVLADAIAKETGGNRDEVFKELQANGPQLVI